VQRTQEIGVRLALGAPRRQVVALVLRGAMKMTALGIGAGIAGSLIFGRWVDALLYGIHSRDLVVYALGCGVLVAMALVAAYLPARRASAIDPAVSLRAE
jgi:ABC-type antimicrobial peptide transport system permease subunit